MMFPSCSHPKILVGVLHSHWLVGNLFVALACAQLKLLRLLVWLLDVLLTATQLPYLKPEREFQGLRGLLIPSRVPPSRRTRLRLHDHVQSVESKQFAAVYLRQVDSTKDDRLDAIRDRRSTFAET